MKYTKVRFENEVMALRCLLSDNGCVMMSDGKGVYFITGSQIDKLAKDGLGYQILGEIEK